jgi:hypothetical protein
MDGTRVAAAAARLIATSVLGTTDRIHAPPIYRPTWGEGAQGSNARSAITGPMVAALTDALPDCLHLNAWRHQDVVEPQQGRERPSVLRPSRRPASSPSLVGIPQPVREEPPEAGMVAGGVEVAGDHQRSLGRTDLWSHGPPLGHAGAGLPLGSTAAERGHRVEPRLGANHHGGTDEGSAQDILDLWLHEGNRHQRAIPDAPCASRSPSTGTGQGRPTEPGHRRGEQDAGGGGRHRHRQERPTPPQPDGERHKGWRPEPGRQPGRPAEAGTTPHWLVGPGRQH